MMHFGWDYEETTVPYYHIYPLSTEAEAAMDDEAIAIRVPQTPEADGLVGEIVDRLERLADRSG